MSQPYVGQIIAVGFNFAPQGWLMCNGALVPIADYDVLFNLIGTTYGGDGQTTFALPDLRGRAALNVGQGPSLPPYALGQSGGAENVTLAATQIAAHSHTLLASSQAGSASAPGPGVVLGQNGQPLVNIYAPPPSTTSLAGAAIGFAPGGQPHENRQPFLVLNYIIAAYGIYPSQS
ncbi:MAG TPA: tail fiber protein [Rhodopila sp.]|nr:tail fiber protein [Rhodopila sp.]